MSSSSLLASDPAFATFCTPRSALPIAVPIPTATRVSLLFLAIVVLHSEESHPIPERFHESLTLTELYALTPLRRRRKKRFFREDFRRSRPWKGAIRGCAFRSRQKSRCIARAQTAAARVHQFPPVALRSARCRRLSPQGHCSSAPSGRYRNWIGQSRRLSP